MTSDELAAVRRALPDIVETVLFQLLAAFDHQETTDGPVRLTVRAKGVIVENPAECSDQLPGELLLRTGWLARFATKTLPSRQPFEDQGS